MGNAQYIAQRAIAAGISLALLWGAAFNVQAQSRGAVPQPPAVVMSNRHFEEGMRAYVAGDFKEAIPLLKASLEELKTAPAFEASLYWRLLVDNLGMSYGITGDLKNAKATFDYGVSKDPGYPMFHYNLACTFAESGDRDKAISELRQAFALKANSNPGESVPNPATDDSFARFMKDPTFRAALDEIRKAGRMFPDRLDFTVEAAPWALTIQAGEFQVTESRQAPDGKHGYFLFSDDKTGLTASIYVEPAVTCADSKSCRDLVRDSNLGRLPGPENVSSSELEGVSVFEYFLPLVQGQRVRQHNLYAEFVRDGFWVDLHISKVLYKAEDHRLFEELVRSVKFEKKK